MTAKQQLVKPSTIYLVRHAEKESGDNPALTPAGIARANKLATLLAHEDISTIFSSDFLRTQQTAEPLASQKKLDIITYNHRELAAFATLLKRDYQEKTVLVVGHSNSTPALASLLEGTQTYPDFDEADYSNIIKISMVGEAGPVVQFLSF